jgi:hypothetical protein
MGDPLESKTEFFRDLLNGGTKGGYFWKARGKQFCPFLLASALMREAILV